MAWQSPYQNATFSEPLIRQVLAIIKRDMSAALAWYQAALLPEEAQPLPAFMAYQLAAAPELQTPVLLVTDRIAFDVEWPWPSQKEDISLAVLLGLTHQNPQVLAWRARAYSVAIKAVLDAAWGNVQAEAVNPFFSTALPLPAPPFSPGLVSPGVPNLKMLVVQDLGFSMLAQSKKTFLRSVSLGIKATIAES